MNTHDFLLKSLLGDRFAVATAKPALVDDELFPEERRFIARAGAARRAEFGTVRVCARRALAELGVSPCALAPSPDRSPLWPDGVVGSLSHTDDLCAAVATNAPNVQAVGIDIEHDSPLDRDLEAVICTQSEQAWILNQDPFMRGALGKAFFSAKESFYKCQYVLNRTFLDFKNVELKFDMRNRTFHIINIDAPIGSTFRLADVTGRFGYAAHHLMTVATIDRPSRASRPTR